MIKKIKNYIEKYGNITGFIISVIMALGLLIGIPRWVGVISERTEQMRNDINEIKRDIKLLDELSVKFSIMEKENDKLNDNLSKLGNDFNNLNGDLKEIKGIIFGNIKYIGGMGGGEFEKVKSYKGTVGIISAKTGSSTYTGSYNPNDNVAAVNKASKLGKDILMFQYLYVMRSEYAEDFKGGSFTGPSVTVKVVDLFCDPKNPKRYLLLSESAASEIGLTKEKGIMEVMITKASE